MYSIEFETVVNSPYIKLENYLDFVNKRVKVIILSEPNKPSEIKDANKVFFDTLRNRDLKIDKSIDIDHVMNEMNNGLS